MLIFAGTYERFLFGFQAAELPGTAREDAAQEPASLERRYTFAAHQNAVKCVAAGGHWLASGGCDDQIHLYDMKHGRDAGFLMNPGDGAVPCIEFYCPPAASGGPSHMLTGSADGSIAIWQAGGGWEHLKLMKGHKGSINALAIHPSGRVALSCAHDRTLRMWDMARGRCTYTAKLDAEADGLRFGPSGAAYALMAGAKVTVHSVGGEGGLLATLTHPRRALALLQQSDSVLLTGCEDGSLKVWDLRTSSVQQSVERAHASRVRGLAAVSAGSGALPELLASASSDGVVKLWDARKMSAPAGGAGRAEPVCLAQAATRARITSLAVVNPKAPGAVPVPVSKPSAEAVEAAAAAQAAAPKAAARQQAQAGTRKQAGGKQNKKHGKQQHSAEIEIVPQERSDDEFEVVPQRAAKQQHTTRQPADKPKQHAAPPASQPKQPAKQQQPAKQHKQSSGAGQQQKHKTKPQQGGKPSAGLGVQQGGVVKKQQQQQQGGKQASGGPAGGGGKKKFSMQLSHKAKGGK